LMNMKYEMPPMNLPEPFLIDDSAFSLKALRSRAKALSVDHAVPEWRRDLFTFIRMFLDKGGEAIIQKTSGTTGEPAKVNLKRSAMIRSAEMTLDFFRLQPGDPVLLCLPVRYIAGKMMVVRALAGGLRLVTTEPASRPLKQVSRTFRFASMVPLQVHESVQHGDPLSLLDQLLVGGGGAYPALLRELEKLERPVIHESFAMSETYSHFALRRVNGTSPDSHFRLMEGVRIRRDQRGCLVVQVQGVTDGEVVTGDLVEIGRDGKGFRWMGRIDHVFKSGGIKVVPEVLEQRIGGWLKRPCLVLPEEDPGLGQRIVLLVETGGHPAPAGQWEELLRKKLPGHARPKRIVTVREFPRNSSFKPDRRAAAGLIGRGY